MHVIFFYQKRYSNCTQSCVVGVGGGGKKVQGEHSSTALHCTAQCACLDPWVLVGKWADPSGTAMLGQPMNESEQAPELIPLSKISLISKGTHGPRIRY